MSMAFLIICHLASLPFLLAALLCNGHVVTLINTHDGNGRFELYDSLPARNASCLQTQHAFKVTCNSIDDLHVALMHLLSSRSEGTGHDMERSFNALIFSGTPASDIGLLDENINAILGKDEHDNNMHADSDSEDNDNMMLVDSDSEDDDPPPKVSKHR